MKCRHESAPNTGVVDENEIAKLGIGCLRVLIGGMFNPECNPDKCSYLGENNE